MIDLDRVQSAVQASSDGYVGVVCRQTPCHLPIRVGPVHLSTAQGVGNIAATVMVVVDQRAWQRTGAFDFFDAVAVMDEDWPHHGCSLNVSTNRLTNPGFASRTAK